MAGKSPTALSPISFSHFPFLSLLILFSNFHTSPFYFFSADLDQSRSINLTATVANNQMHPMKGLDWGFGVHVPPSKNMTQMCPFKFLGFAHFCRDFPLSWLRASWGALFAKIWWWEVLTHFNGPGDDCKNLLTIQLGCFCIWDWRLIFRLFIIFTALTTMCQQKAGKHSGARKTPKKIRKSD